MKKSIKKINSVSSEKSWNELLTFEEVYNMAKDSDFNSELLLAYYYYYEGEKFSLAYDIVSKEKFNDDIYAQVLISSMYYYGKGVEQSFSKSGEILLRERIFDYPISKYNIACLYQEDTKGEFEFNKEKGYAIAMEALEKGYAPAYYYIGWCYYFGEGIEKDVSKALEYFLTSVYLDSDDDNYSYYFLALIYSSGESNIPKNIKEAIKWATEGAKRGCIDSIYFLGLTYLYGDRDGIPVDLDLAISWFEKLEGKEHFDYLYTLGLSYFEKYKKEKNISYLDKAISLLKRSVEQRDKAEDSKTSFLSANLLALIYSTEEKYKNVDDYLFYLTKSKVADRLSLIKLFFLGKGESTLKVNEDVLIKLTKMSLADNDIDSRIRIAKFFIQGKDVGMNKSEIIELLNDNINSKYWHTHLKSYYYLGLIAESSIEDKNNILKANEYYKKAIELSIKLEDNVDLIF